MNTRPAHQSNVRAALIGRSHWYDIDTMADLEAAECVLAQLAEQA